MDSQRDMSEIGKRSWDTAVFSTCMIVRRGIWIWPVFLSLVVCLVGVGDARTISTIAGDKAGDGGSATSAPIYTTQSGGISVDGDGNIYISDKLRGRVRKIDASGVISTVAGKGGLPDPGIGDGGPATDAILSRQDMPIAVDDAGNLFIVGEYRVRKVDTSGIITTVAGNGTLGYSGDGGPATSAQFGLSLGIAVDPSGNLYIADTQNDRVRKVDTSGIITTVAGNGTRGYAGDGGSATSAQLKGPYGIAVDPPGNLYIADSGNHCVRKVDTSGIITTVAGDGTQGYSGDSGPATSAQLDGPYDVAFDTFLYIADTGNHRIRKVDNSGQILTFAGDGTQAHSGDGGSATSAQLDSPGSLAVDEDGNFYIGERLYVRKVNQTGVISTVAGNGTASFSGDGGQANDASLYEPRGIYGGSDGDLYIADSANHRIRKIDSSGIISTIAGNGTTDFSGDGGPATDAGLRWPQGVFVDRDGNIYTASQYRIRKVDTSGIITTVAGNGSSGYSGDGGLATSAGLVPNDVFVDRVGNLYVADTGNQCIRKVDTSGIITTVAGNGTRGFSGDGGPATSAQLSDPFGVVVDATGNIYIADTYNHLVRKVDTSGIITTVAGSGDRYGEGELATSARLDMPNDVALDNWGNLYISNGGSITYSVRMVDTSGIISTVAGNGTYYERDGVTGAEFVKPSGVFVDGADNVYITDEDYNRARKVTASTYVPEISLSDTELDFGEVDVRTTSTLSLTVSNIGDATLNVTDIDFARMVPAFSATPSAFDVEPGESQDVVVSFSPMTEESVGDTLFIVNNASGSPHHVVLNGEGYIAGPTGDPTELVGKIAFSSFNPADPNDSYNIYVMDADGANIIKLTNNSADDYHPSWSPDGSQIVYESNLDGDKDIYVMDADGTNIIKLTNNSADDYHPTWSPDGSQIVFASLLDGGSDTDIYVMDADGTNIIKLTSNSKRETFPMWSPDGSKITFDSDRDGDTDIYVMDADGANVVQMTNNSVWNRNATWSPDGSKMAFR